MTKFTKGPWKLHPLYETCVCGPDTHDGDDLIIAPLEVRGLNTPSSYCLPTYKSQKANARLIAAAPCMYEALEYLKQFVENGVEYGYINMPDADTPDKAHDVFNIINKALAKAKGETDGS